MCLSSRCYSPFFPSPFPPLPPSFPRFPSPALRSFLSFVFHLEKSFPLNRAWFRVLNICFTAYSLLVCGSFLKFARVSAWKKVVIIFGSYGKRLYLCTRFREAGPCEAVRIGSVTIERVHWKSYIKRESSTRAWMVLGGIFLLRGHPRVKKKRTVIIPVYAGHIWGCEKKRDKRVSPGSPETEQMPFPYGWRLKIFYNEEFDPGSGWTLATGLTHASRGAAWTQLCWVWWRPAHGWVTRIQPALYSGIVSWKGV